VTAARPSRALVAVSLVVGAAFAAPFAYVVWRNITLGSDVLETVFSAATLGPLWRTLQLAVLVSLSTAVLGTALAWLITRTDLPGRRVWRVLAPLPLVYPSFVGALAFISALAPGGLLDELLAPLGADKLPTLSGLPGSWLVLTVFTYPFVLLPVAARLGALPPSLEESARLLGRKPAAVFRTVVLPQTRSSILAGTLLVFLYVVSDFGAVAVMRYDTLTRAIFSTRLFDRPVSFAQSLVLGVVALAVVVAERQVAARAPTTQSVRARAPMQLRLGPWKPAAVLLLVATVAVGLVGPLLALGHWAIRGIDQGGGGRLAEDLGELVVPTFNTAGISLLTAAVAVAVVLPVAYLTARFRTRAGAAANAFVVGGFALPGLVIALALVFWTLSVDALGFLYQSFALLVFAYVVHFGAQSVRTAQVAVASMPARLDDAARMLGAGRLRRFATIELPLMRPGLVAGAGLVLLSTMKELPATLLLAPTGFNTLATRIWNAQTDGFYADVGLASIVLLALSALLTWLLVVRRAERFA
jgi:iron(III) transport system permease protein